MIKKCGLVLTDQAQICENYHIQLGMEQMISRDRDFWGVISGLAIQWFIALETVISYSTFLLYKHMNALNIYWKCRWKYASRYIKYRAR